MAVNLVIKENFFSVHRNIYISNIYKKKVFLLDLFHNNVKTSLEKTNAVF